MKNSWIRSKTVSVVLMFSILAMVISCDEESPVGDLEGVVLFAGTNIPVAGVNISVEGLNSVSSEDGSYRIDRIETGKKTLSAEKIGFVPFSTEIDIQEGFNMMPVPMHSPVFTATVHGIITGDLSGNPKTGLTVIMLNPDDSESGINGISDENGNYQLQNVPVGERVVVVKSAGSIVAQLDFSLTQAGYKLDITISEPMVFTDSRDGKSYDAVKIGDQIWMQENLAYLPLVNAPDQGADTLERYYVYGYQGTNPAEAVNTANYSIYGVLYNWKAAESACPDGWHLPTDAEWKALEIYLGMEPENADTIRWRTTGEVGTKLKTSSGWESDGNGNNLSGFSALPGGARDDAGTFSGSGIRCNFWTASLNSFNLPWNRFLSYDNIGVSRFGLKKSLGFSVRCVKDK